MENTGPIWLCIFGQIYICLGLVLGYLTDLLRPPLNARDAAASIAKIQQKNNA